jgi:5,10-methylenetetrahydromethanopterin reductase
MTSRDTATFKLGVIIESKWPIEKAIDYAKIAEGSGYEYAWVNDYIFDRDPFCVLSLLACNTAKIKMGTAVVNPYLRHPAMIAASIATVATLARGRTILGLGSSVNAMMKPIAVTVENPIETCKETIDIVRLLLRGGVADYHGSKFKLDRAKLSFKPEEQVPIYLALAAGKRMMKLCGEYADGAFLMEATEEFHIDVMNTVREAQKSSKTESRLPFETVANQLVSVGKNGKEAIDSLKPVMAENLARKGPGVAMMGLDIEKAQQYVKEPSTIPDEFMQRFCLCGTVDDCLDHIATLRKIGITQVAHRFPSPEQMKAAGSLLIPAIKEQYG